MKFQRGFNRINSDRSIPTAWLSRPIPMALVTSFNRINPNRSIPTRNRRNHRSARSGSFKRINPNRLIPTWQEALHSFSLFGGFNHINSDRSIPTRRNGAICVSRCTNVSIVSIKTDQSRLHIC